MNTDNALATISNEFANVEQIRERMIQPKKIQLHTGMEGFESPDAYGIYRHTGGKALGVVGKTFQPMDLNLFLDTIMESLSVNSDLDLSKLEYVEYQDGSIVAFRLPLREYQIASPMKGDVTKTSLQFRTGYNGTQKISLTYDVFRIWCENGSGNWQNEIQLQMKNTLNNQVKILITADKIAQAMDAVDSTMKMWEESLNVALTKKMVDKFLTNLTGYDVKGYKDLTTRKRNILDAINASVAIETANTGQNLYSLLQGVTRYTTHDLAGGDTDKIFFATAAKLNQRAHQLVAAMVN